MSLDLFNEVQQIISNNKSECGIRGGSATRHKYDKIREKSTLEELHRFMSEQFGSDGYKIIDECVYVLQPEQNWQLFATSLGEAKKLMR